MIACPLLKSQSTFSVTCFFFIETERGKVTHSLSVWNPRIHFRFIPFRFRFHWLFSALIERMKEKHSNKSHIFHPNHVKDRRKNESSADSMRFKEVIIIQFSFVRSHWAHWLPLFEHKSYDGMHERETIVKRAEKARIFYFFLMKHNILVNLCKTKGETENTNSTIPNK